MIFVGSDKNYERQYFNCAKTIKSKVFPITYDQRKGSTAFTFARFLVPEKTAYNGWHIFCDSDFLFLDDVNKLLEYKDDQYAVCVVKHKPYQVNSVKMDKKKNLYYDRKNWASLILWNSAHKSNRVLSEEYIRKSKALHLLQFKWLEDEEIGEIPKEWNILVDHQSTKGALGLHFTNGIENKYYEKCLNYES
tara:strand:+ start:918 stop:1493 length:576 start_codon:yes stop_codon:yes gene_type:complete